MYLVFSKLNGMHTALSEHTELVDAQVAMTLEMRDNTANEWELRDPTADHHYEVTSNSKGGLTAKKIETPIARQS